MGLKALITLDIPYTTDEKRTKFYEKLKEEKWGKIENLTTAWQASFNDGVERTGAINTLEADIEKAKNHSSINKVSYAIQVGNGNLKIS